ncbi:hypothetical protein BT69DRAFT_1283464 [Atractiella rhizophila]|nr:hypothetical protein BT69DRAFT_1283464 [Atractiella rhizophila]
MRERDELPYSHAGAPTHATSSPPLYDLKRKRTPPGYEAPRPAFDAPTRLQLPKLHNSTDLYRDVRPKLSMDDERSRDRDVSPSVELQRAVETFKSRVYTDLERMRSENRALMLRNDKLEDDLKQQNRYIQTLLQRITELERNPARPTLTLPPTLDSRSTR